VTSKRYAAAKITPSAGGWLPVNEKPNDLIERSKPIVTPRVRYLVRDFGKLKMDRAVLNSGDAFKEFMGRLVGYDSFHLAVSKNY
jgi:hypothetical protein